MIGATVAVGAIALALMALHSSRLWQARKHYTRTLTEEEQLDATVYSL